MEDEETLGKLAEIIQQVTGKKTLLRYTRLDLIKFVCFYEEQKKSGKGVMECAALHDGLLKYWRKECAIHGAAYEEIWAGIDLIDECCANLLAELTNKTSKP